MIGRGAFAVFLGVVVLALAQVAWWIAFLVRIGGDRRHIIMFISEGSFFIVALLGGLFLIYRTLSEQVRLREMRATFLSAVTHELKSPIAAIRLFLETLDEGRVTDEAKRRELVKKMLLDTSRLEHVVADLLRAGQIEAHALAPVLEPDVDLAAVVAEVVEAMRARLAAGDSIELTVSGEVRGAADRGLMRTAVENLVDNAMKYPAPPRRIEVCVGSCVTDGGRPGARVEVVDSGPWIGAERAARLFQPFERAGDEMVRKTSGTGLGLFIVRGIAEAHGGVVCFSQGSRGGPDTNHVGFTIPLEASAS